MKKIFAVLLSAALFAGMLAGCGSKPAASGDSTEMKEGQTIQTVVDQIIDEVGIAMPAEIDDALMKDVFYIDPEKDVDEYYGQFAMVNVSADNLLAVKAKPEQKDAVIEAMGKRLKDVQARPVGKGANGPRGRPWELCVPGHPRRESGNL